MRKESQNENTCECSSSPFIDVHHNHVITGNLDIVKNDSLKTLLKQGPNFREQKSKTNFSHKNVKMGINECIDVWAQRENVPIESLSEWKVKLLSKVKTKLEKVKKHPRKVPLEVLKDPKVLEDLKELHSKFIFVPVDKASNILLTISHLYVNNFIIVSYWMNLD